MPRSTRVRRDGEPRKARPAARRAEPRIVREIRQNVGKHVAIARDWSRVVAVGATFKEALEQARAAGFPDAPVILAAKNYSAVSF